MTITLEGPAPVARRARTALGVAGTVAANALLIDAAIETVLSGAPVRWWIAGAVLAYLASTVLLWWWAYRGGKTTPALETFGFGAAYLLLGLTAASAWSPAGLDHGLRLAGQPTATVLAIVSALATVLALWSLQPILRPVEFASRGRLALATVVVVASTYGMAAFLLAVRNGTPYTALYDGRSFWQPLPFWLQGAVVGGLGVVAIALVAQAVPAVFRTGSPTRRALALALSLVMTTAGLQPLAMALPRLDDRMRTATRPEAYTEGIRKVQQLAAPASLPVLFDAIEQRTRTTNRAMFDVGERARELGRDVATVFAFVRDQVRFEPYEGVLRGDRGTLMSMAGNSFDKSVLLASLLTTDGFDVRFVRGRLDEARAGDLVVNARTRDDRTPAASQTAAETALAPILAAGMNGFMDAAVNRWMSSAATLQEMLKSTPLGQDPPAADKALIAEITGHVWIEYRQGDAWVALDPSFPSAAPGRTFATVVDRTANLPPTVFHTVTINVSVEQRSAAGSNVRKLLRHDTTAAALNGTSVFIMNEVSASASGWSATPVVQVGEQRFKGAAFDEGTAATAGAGGAIGSLGERLFGEPAQASQAGAVAAEWIDFDFRYPSGRTESVRRWIFDRIGPAARARGTAASAPLAPSRVENGVPVALRAMYGCSFSSTALDPGYISARVARQLPALRAASRLLESVRNAGYPPATSNARQIGETLTPVLPDLLSGIASSFHRLSHDSLARITASAGNVARFYEATPRLAIASLEARDAPGGAVPRATLGLDLRRNDVRVIGEVGADQLAWTNILRGAFDAALEHAMLASADNGNAPLSALNLVTGTPATRTLLASIARQQDVDAIPVSADVRARMAATLGSRVLLIAPARPLAVANEQHLAWWRVDLDSGETVAVYDNGLHFAGAGTELTTYAGKVIIIPVATIPGWVVYSLALNAFVVGLALGALLGVVTK